MLCMKTEYLEVCMDWNLDFLPDLPILMPFCCRRDDYFDDEVSSSVSPWKSMS